MTNQDLIRVLNGLSVDLDQLNASQKRLYDSAQRLMWIFENFQRQVRAAAAGGQGLEGSGNQERIGAGRAGSGGGQGQILAATRQMQETQMLFNLQYLSLQSQMQNENRQFSLLSNMMKTKHDTVRNSIGNIR